MILINKNSNTDEESRQLNYYFKNNPSIIDLTTKIINDMIVAPIEKTTFDIFFKNELIGKIKKSPSNKITLEIIKNELSPHTKMELTSMKTMISQKFNQSNNSPFTSLCCML